KLYEESQKMSIHTVKKSQKEISNELGITRQALNNHLRELKKLNFIRTGRKFVDLTEDAIKYLEKDDGKSYIFVKIKPNLRNEAFEKLKKIDFAKIFRVTGELDAIVIINESQLDRTLNEINLIEGVEETSAHIVIQRFESKPNITDNQH
ncbi:MAG: winged helix-turn-helix transcriptional regulator, partial [Euryarchaeota archaeon]|nr:winged helix-turn-helix transcriptional regulator [Euryarchaeota archaeon]